MTPLAQRIVNDMMMAPARRAFVHPVDPEGDYDPDLLEEIVGASCFDLGDVWSAVPRVAWKLSAKSADGKTMSGGMEETGTAFLPSPVTWIEWRFDDPSPQRHGMLLVDVGEGMALGVLCVGFHGGWFGAVAHVVMAMKDSAHAGEIKMFDSLVPWFPGEYVTSTIRDMYGALAMINTPAVIGRRENPPHRGLQKSLAAATRGKWAFKLKPWTVITLQVTPPDVNRDGATHGFSGKKALHFCRTHLRVQNGRLVLVSSHWRGDPALGIVQSTYKIKPDARGG